MERQRLGGAEFAPETTYLNTPGSGLLPARTIAALREEVDASASYGTMGTDYFGPADAARASFARLVGTTPDRVAIGSSVAVSTALIAASLPDGAEVLLPEGDFSSLVNPFTVRPGLRVRTAPLERLADAVRPGTALVALSAVQALDGRIADLEALREAARTHGARTLVDMTQAAGWLPLDARRYDYVVCGAYKWLLCPRSTSFLVVGEDAPQPEPLHASWVAGADPGEANYGPVTRLAEDAHRYDEPHGHLAHIGARHSLALLEEVGVVAVHAHNTALAERYRAGLAELGYAALPAPGSAIVTVPALADAHEPLARQGILVAVRAGKLRTGFHLYNTAEDVDRLLAGIKALDLPRS
ncbi:aminotransferase class V-fold PLP-dependent enzyme [Streptomyces sp. Ru73]|uniref:aminotransferase class V-fold PLP-dependent enzyme n=1 Tax=Streptomyces sp. Ru73 TaxID=2080748 RepID=UPI002155FBF7|nr:aminotransferase class V-fold PLP-dependent enzyme [Streptomyces sp. Ru73]